MLQRREQILVVSAGVLVLLAALFTFVVDPLLARAANLDRRLAAAGRQFSELQALRVDYRRQKRIIDRIDAQLRRQPRTFVIFSHLEQMAGQTGIQDRIQSMNTVAGPPNTIYKEDSVEVKMEGCHPGAVHRIPPPPGTVAAISEDQTPAHQANP